MLARSPRRFLACLPLALGLLAGCQADYSADITNRTSQPIFVRIFRKGPSEPVLGDARRLGPGDRAPIGPVRTTKDYGAFLSVDTMNTASNPIRPVTVLLLPGEAYFEVQQDGEGPTAPLRIIPKP